MCVLQNPMPGVVLYIIYTLQSYFDVSFVFSFNFISYLDYLPFYVRLYNVERWIGYLVVFFTSLSLLLCFPRFNKTHKNLGHRLREIKLSFLFPTLNSKPDISASNHIRRVFRLQLKKERKGKHKNKNQDGG